MSIDAHTLFDSLTSWPEARDNYMALDSVEQRTLPTTPATRLFFNPARVRSTAAKVDAESVRRRPCFLCRPNRPARQEYVLWRDYEVLVNPFPIFPHHLTIVSSIHVPQSLTGRVADLFALAVELPQYAVFFNGGQCGASAPDHAHFQAAMELRESEVLRAILDDGGKPIVSNADGLVVASEASGRLAYHIVCHDAMRAAGLFATLATLRTLDENMLNAVATCRRDGTVDIVIVPRRRFRPWQFDAQGEAQIMISPATVEVLGLFVLPRREDFEKISAADAIDIISQVCFTSDNELTISNK
ncbi:MAG: DUF4922 domain-containing protein [Bacteroidales bacterium]|nr:DUF4922 domain-containing protein [Bacteroidales bacterium]